MQCALPLQAPARAVPLFVQWEQYVPQYLDSVVNATFVQVGASCGMNSRRCAVGGDPIWEYATRCGWRGVVVEPVWSPFKRLVENYRPFPLVRPKRALVTHRDSVNGIRVRGETSQALEGARAGSKGVQFPPVRSLRGVWPRYAVDVLVVDAEGSEEDILVNATFPTLPRLVLFEHVHLSQGARANIDERLRRLGYHQLADLKHQDRIGRTMEPQDRLYGLARKRQALQSLDEALLAEALGNA